MTKFSVVTASFEQSRFLSKCVESVRRNSRKHDVEYLVMDGGSTDGTVDVLERNEDTVDVWCSKPDLGPAAALNEGFSRASGEIYGCINADDYFLPESLARIHNLFMEDQDVDVVYGHGIMVDSVGRTISRIYSDRWDLERMLYGRCSIVQQGTFFRAKAFKRAGGFNEENGTCWDAELLVDMAVKGARFRRLDDKLGAFRIHGSSISGSGRLQEEYRRDRKRIREKILGEESPAAVKMKTKWFGARRVFVEPRITLERVREQIRRTAHRVRHRD